jgi:hypothetical protein
LLNGEGFLFFSLLCIKGKKEKRKR